MRCYRSLRSRFWGVLLGALVCVALLSPATFTHPTRAESPALPPTDSLYVPGEVLIGWRPASGILPHVSQPSGLDEKRDGLEWQRAAKLIAARTGLEVLDVHPAYGAARLSVPVGQEQAEIARLAALPWVTYAEPNYIAHSALRQAPLSIRSAGFAEHPLRTRHRLSGAERSRRMQDVTSYPNDPYIGDEWNMRRVGAPAAWDVTLGSYSIVVAVIDSGIDSHHPEFANRLLPGRDYVNSDDDPNDDFGHGTHVAGILAAVANNKVGVAGLAPNIKLLPLKVLDAQGSGNYDDIASAIERAADSSVQVINLSLGGLAYSDRLQTAVDYALDHNVLLVAAAGNCAQGGWACNYRTNPDYYPAACSGVLAVAASDHYDHWASYSGHKPYIALAAPGGTAQDQIWSTVPGGYDFEYGTSMATPLVSAAAALVWTLQPAATYTQVSDILENTADKVGSYAYTGGRNDYFGYGRLNAAHAVRWAYPPALQPITETLYFLLGSSTSHQSINLPLINPSDQAVWWQASVTYGAQWLNVSPASGATNYGTPSTLVVQAGPTAVASGIYTGTIQVQALHPQASSFNIQAQLQITTALQRSYMPFMSHQTLKASWIDPLDGGQLLNIANDSARQLLLPFTIDFYGQTHNALWASDNGLVFFDQPEGSALYNQSDCLPSAAAPNDAIYVLWQDWDPDLGGQVYAQQVGDDEYVITWYQMKRTAGDTPHSFQLVLWRDGRLLLQYQAIGSPIDGTIGVENFDGTVAEQAVCNGKGRLVNSGDALVLRPELPW